METHEKIIMPNIVKYLNFVGLSRTKTKTSTAKNILIHGSGTAIFLFTSVPEFLFICTGGYETAEKIEVFLVFISVAKVVIKILNRIFTIDEFWTLFDELQRLYASEQDEKKLKILEEKTKESRLILKATVIIYVALSSSFYLTKIVLTFIYRMMGQPVEFQLPRKAHYYFDTTKNPAFIIIFVSQLISSALCVQGAVWDALFLICSNYVLSQVKFISIDFMSLSRDEKATTASKVHANQRAPDPIMSIENDLSECTNAELNDLTKCIRKHIMVTALVQKLEKLFGLQIAVDCTAAGIVGCLSVFQATHTSDFLVMGPRVLLAMFTYGILYVLFYYGQQIYDEVFLTIPFFLFFVSFKPFCMSSRLPELVYALPWRRCGVGYARTVALVLHQSQQPLVVTGLHFYTLQKETFLSLVRGSYSYFTLLQTMTDN